MSEFPRQAHGEHESGEPQLNREPIVASLQEQGIDVEVEDWQDYDDNEVIGDIATLAAMYGLDIDRLLEICGVPIEYRQDGHGFHNFETGEEEVR